MSFGEGNLHEQVKQLKAELEAERKKKRYEFVVDGKSSRRVEQLESLVRDMYFCLYDEACATCEKEPRCDGMRGYYERMKDLGLTEVE